MKSIGDELIGGHAVAGLGVGATAIDRFPSPVCSRNFPAALLRAEVDDPNSLALWRKRDGKLVRQ